MSSFSLAATRICSPFRTGEQTGTYITIKPATEADIINLAQTIALKRLAQGPTISQPALAYQYLQTLLSPLDYEVFGVVFLNSHNRIIQFEVMFRGTLNSCSVHPKQIVKRTVELNAAAVLLVHNHPSGNTEPSDADKRLTIQLQNALELIDVPVLDHLIVSAKGWYSFAEHHLI